MGIELKSTAALCDELFTTLLKCWHHQEVVMKSEDVEEIARAAKLAQSTNDRRNQLMRAIDQRLGDGYSAALTKSYTHEVISEGFHDTERIEALELALSRLLHMIIDYGSDYGDLKRVALETSFYLFPKHGESAVKLSPTNERLLLLEMQLKALSDAVLHQGWGGNPVQIANVSLQILGHKS